MDHFELVSPFQPMGDQPQAIKHLVQGIKQGDDGQILLGVTGSGKTFTMANVIAELNRPTLIIAHNKTLAGQLCAEFKAFFPHNAVEYFISYYDYYQPEAYIPGSDTYIEKDAAINDEIDRMRHSATASLIERRDVIVVASVSCIYGLGAPSTYKELMVHLRPGQVLSRDALLEQLVKIQYLRNDYERKRGTFAVKGDTVDIYPSNYDRVFVRVSFFGDEIESLQEYDCLNHRLRATRSYVGITPASHYASTDEKTLKALRSIEEELDARLKLLQAEGKLVEAYRLEQRTRYDLELLRETGFCKGIENYSRHLDGRQPGQAPYTLLDFFPNDYLLMIDESHVTVPQLGAMYQGDRSRKRSLIDFGFRLPSAYDNRPLNFEEFEQRMGQTIFVSATPSTYEKEHATSTVEQVIRPTGLLDPEVEIHSTEGQIDYLLEQIHQRIQRDERTLVLTLTKKSAEQVAEFLAGHDIKVSYLHSDIKNEERLEILRKLRAGSIDVIVGINLLREGIDLPEVSLIAIFDADKEGFLRSTTSLIQTMGRAARNVHGHVLLFADEITDSMYRAIEETNRRRVIQAAYNEAHGLVPHTVKKEIRESLDTLLEESGAASSKTKRKGRTTSQGRTKRAGELALFDEGLGTGLNEASTIRKMGAAERLRLADHLERKMNEAAANLDFERAAELRDLMMIAREELEA